MKTSPDRVEPIYAMGHCLMLMEIYDEAEAWYNKALEMEPGLYQVYNDLGLINMETALFTEAEANFKKSLEIEPNYFDANFNLGRLYFDQEQYDRADRYLSRAVTVNGTDPEALKYLVMNRIKLGKAEGMLPILKSAIEASPEDPLLYVSLGTIYRSTGKYSEALDAYEKAVDLDGEEADAYIGIGDTYLVKGSRKEAEEAYMKAVEIDPASYESYLSLAAMYRQDNRIDKAIGALKRVIEIKPDLHEVYVDIAELILSLDEPDDTQRTKHLNEALTLVGTSLKAYSDYSRGHAVKGKILLALGKKNEAIAEFKTALKYDSANAEAKDMLAKLGTKDATGEQPSAPGDTTEEPAPDGDAGGTPDAPEKDEKPPEAAPPTTTK
jgi:tetratricopeptide (TPR) repeat protein